MRIIERQVSSKGITSRSSSFMHVAEQENRSGDDDARRRAPGDLERSCGESARSSTGSSARSRAPGGELSRDRPIARFEARVRPSWLTAGSSAANIAGASLSRIAREDQRRADLRPALEIGRERGRAGRVVRGVEQHLAAVRQTRQLEASGPVGLREAVRDRRRAERRSPARSSDLEQPDGDGRVRRLMGSRQADRESLRRRAAPCARPRRRARRATSIDHGDGRGRRDRRRPPARRA